jgi:transposase-like protein
MANHSRNGGKEQFWRDVLGRQAASGLSLRAFCQQENLTEATLYWWRRTIAERDASLKPSRQAKRLTASSPIKGVKRTPVFVPAVVKGEPSHGGAITLELAGGRALRLPASIPAQRLAELVLAIEARAAR